MPVEVPGSSEGLGRIPQLPAPPVTQEVMHREEECEEDGPSSFRVESNTDNSWS